VASSKIVTTGTVLWFNEKKGFGFIKPDAAGPDLFVHISDVVAAGRRHLDEGERVSFTAVDQGNGRWYAVDLTILGGN
jgi:cold shock CspA family protein